MDTRSNLKKLYWYKFLSDFLLIAPVFILLGVFKLKIFIVLVLLNAIIWGVSTPVVMNIINQETGSDVRATVLSVSNMFSRLLYVLIAPIFGLVTDVFSLSAAFVLMGVFYIILGSLILGLLVKHKYI